MRTAKVLKTAATIEPVTLAEIKAYLRLDSVEFTDSVVVSQSIVAGSHNTAAAYSLTGTSVDVLGSSVLVVLDCGANGTSGTVDVKLQDSDNNSTWSDVTSGAFTQVTEANDNAIYTKAYTGVKQYLRVVSTVAVAACNFGVSIHEQTATIADDTLLNSLIKSARQQVELYLNRALITQTWYYYLQDWPEDIYIELPLGNLQSITELTYKDSDGNSTPVSSGDYIAETQGQLGRLVLDYGEGWPASSLYTSFPIRVEYICGYGAATTDVPEPIRIALRELVAFWYEHRDSAETGLTMDTMPSICNALLSTYRIHNL
jgi:uncharacterized phiE125 gp8 family phage protein